MTIIEIKANEYGGHDNNTAEGFDVPDGWAVLPENVGTPETLENFPFGDITVDDGGAPPIVTSWTPGDIPPEPDPDPEPAPRSEVDILRANIDYLSMMTGIDIPEIGVRR